MRPTVKRSMLAVLALPLLLLSACGEDNPAAPSSGSLVTEDLVVGTGATAQSGDTVTVHYVGTLTNGTKFDSSYDRNQSYTFQLGARQVIAGFDQGVVGMRVGGKRRVTVPPALGYGSQTYLTIPGNSTLVFDIDLLSIAGK